MRRRVPDIGRRTKSKAPENADPLLAQIVL
jgi:hypothetical protein